MTRTTELIAITLVLLCLAAGTALAEGVPAPTRISELNPFDRSAASQQAMIQQPASELPDTELPIGTPSRLSQFVTDGGAESSFGGLVLVPEPQTLIFCAAGGLFLLRSRGRAARS